LVCLINVETQEGQRTFEGTKEQVDATTSIGHQSNHQ